MPVSILDRDTSISAGTGWPLRASCTTRPLSLRTGFLLERARSQSSQVELQPSVGQSKRNRPRPRVPPTMSICRPLNSRSQRRQNRRSSSEVHPPCRSNQRKTSSLSSVLNLIGIAVSIERILGQIASVHHRGKSDLRYRGKAYASCQVNACTDRSILEVEIGCREFSRMNTKTRRWNRQRRTGAPTEICKPFGQQSKEQRCKH